MSTVQVHLLEVVDDTVPMYLPEVLECIRIDKSLLAEWVDAGIASPSGRDMEHWQFARRDLRRMQSALRLMADLQVNPSGAALILDLVEERDELLRRLRLFDGFVAQ